MKTEKRKAFVILPPLMGHVASTASIVSELVKRDFDVWFYGSEAIKGVIEKSGARYVPYPCYDPSSRLFKLRGIKECKNNLLKTVSSLLTFAQQNVPSLLEDVIREEPELIVYDNFSLTARYIYLMLEKRGHKKLPKMVQVFASFAFLPGIHPSEDELKELASRDRDYMFIFLLIVLFIKQFILSWQFGLSIYNPMEFLFSTSPPSLVVTTVFPELQPHVEKFDKNKYKFVGCCVAEDVRKFDIKDADLKKVIDTFEPVNPRKDANDGQSNTEKLIYVSLGTVFNDNDFIIDALIEAIKKLKGRQEIRAVISLGASLYQAYQERIASNRISVPDFIVLQPSVPQIEVLKRASLFVTHMGMNSFGEAVHYGVPLVGIPLSAEQPLNAKRMAELGLGKVFSNPFKLDIDKLAEAMDEVLKEKSYLEKMLEMSQISRKYTGVVNGADEIIRYLDKKTD